MPIPSCPPEIKQLMNIPVVWEGFDGWDGHAQPSYRPAVTLRCFAEEHALGSSGLDAIRLPNGTVVEPILDLFFDGDNANVRAFRLYDRFTPSGIGMNLSGDFDSEPQSLQAAWIATFYGPPFDNKNPWVVRVTL